MTNGGDAYNASPTRHDNLAFECLTGLLLALSAFGALGLAGFVVDIVDHALAVWMAGCPPTLGSFVICGGRPFHLAILTASGLAVLLGLTLLVGRIAAYLIKE